MPSGKSSSLREKAGRGRHGHYSRQSVRSKHLIEVEFPRPLKKQGVTESLFGSDPSSTIVRFGKDDDAFFAGRTRDLGPFGAYASLGYESLARSAFNVASTTSGVTLVPTAVSGSFRPLPVSTQTTVEPSGTPYFTMPAIDAADAGSQKMDS